MFRVLHKAPNFGEATGQVILNLSVIRYFEPSRKGRIGSTLIDVVGGSAPDSGRTIAVMETPDELCAAFEKGTLFVLNLCDSLLADPLDGRPIYLSLSQVRAIEPFADKVNIEFLDGSSVRVKFSSEAQRLIESLR